MTPPPFAAATPASVSAPWRPWATSLVLASLLALPGCASLQALPAPDTPWPERLQTLLPADVLLLGEQHDAADHQRLQRGTVL